MLTACSVGGNSGYDGLSSGAASASTATNDGGNATAGSSSDAAGSSGEGDSASGTSDGGATTAADASEGSGTAVDTSSGDASTGSGTALDPMLDIPDGGQMCTMPGSLTECPGIAVCRFATVEYGLCESCDVCGNLNAPCVEGTDCDILFECYAGRCTNFCTLGTSECGPPDACIDIGHPTRGVCDPFA